MNRLLFAAYSDSHWGDLSERDDHTPADLARMVNELETIGPLCQRDDAPIALAGDIAEGKLYLVEDCIRANRSMFQLTAQAAPKVWWLHGNHDEELTQRMLRANKINITLRPSVIIDGWLIFHNQESDPEPVIWRKVGNGACSLLAWIGNNISHKLEDKAHRWASSLTGSGRNGTPERYIKGAVKFAQQYGCKGVVFGHTHQAGQGVYQGVQWVDLGTWKENGWACVWSDGTVTRYRGQA